jgi:XTP/dITP diphosphohydrolase
MRIVFATRNPGKVSEVKEILAGTGAKILSMDIAGIDGEAVEDGRTLEENATKKALYVAQKTDEWVLAEDTGIFIEALHGAPGVFSARWAGEGVSGEKIAAYTLAKLKRVPAEKRHAWFECVMVLVSSDGRSFTFSGRVDGRITEEPRGQARPKLPYDTIFMPNGLENTFAELPNEIKNGISHRARAAALLIDFLFSQELI